MPAEHEAQSQVNEEAAAGVKAFTRSLTLKKDEISQNSKTWELQRTCMPERDTKVISTREGK